MSQTTVLGDELEGFSDEDLEVYVRSEVVVSLVAYQEAGSSLNSLEVS